MKQFTTPEQTAKLIYLGFEKPKSRVDGEMEEILKVIVPFGDFEVTFSNNYPAYSIGELIEMLQKKVYQIEDSGIPCDLNIDYDGGTWLIVYICERDRKFKTERLDLIDALYDMILTLKEEGVI